MTHFLATDDNPNGYKLEDVLSLIRQDMLKRAQKIMGDNKSEARHVLKNDIKILSLLTECMELAEDSTVLLEKSFGPRDSAHPRIGV